MSFTPDDDLTRSETEQVRDLLDRVNALPRRIRAALWTLQPVVLSRGGIVVGGFGIALTAFVGGAYAMQQALLGE